MKEKDLVSILGLVAANLVPLVMVLLGRWGVAEVLVLYWAETGVVGLFTILRVLFAGAPMPYHKPVTFQQLKTAPSHKTLPLFLADWGLIGKLLLSFFFSLPYFLFMFLQGCALYLFLEFVAGYGWPVQAVKWGVLGLVMGHGVGFVKGYLLSGEFRRTFPEHCVEAPFHRLAILQTVLGCAGWVSYESAGYAVFLMSAFVVVKTGIELYPPKSYGRGSV
ncbi:MAG: DUF6498-containing protein [Elusimicrobiales bacterium]|nr:DUF6498-containing protein [Elusimicrobiales bacterium]